MQLLLPEKTPCEDLPTNYRKIDLKKALSLRIKGLTYREIAKQFDCTHSAVVQRLQGLLPEEVDVPTFQENKANILSAKEQLIIQNLTEDEIKKSSAYQKVGMFSLLHHNERLARGLSTANILYADLSDHELDARIDALEAEMEEKRI